MKKPDILDYLDYRHYLNDVSEYFRMTEKLTLKEFCKRTGLKSTSYLSMLIKGQRRLSKLSIRQISHGFKLTLEETHFFEKLANFQHAVTTAERELAFRELTKFKRFRKLKKLELQQYEILSDLESLLVLELYGESWSKKDRSGFLKKLGLTTKQNEQIVSKLVEGGFLEPVEGKKDYRRKAVALETSPEVASLSIRAYHRLMISTALKALDAYEPANREMQGLTLSLSPENFQKFRAKIREFARECSAEFSDEESPDGVYQLNVQLVPLLKPE